ncbi:hypothetical protein EVAR_61113_1 [Eumeta japonica]|uniref:Uncharacterized protein n=1 Tax=Eumeta variegata TaxID=151549 RepID=A0A4C1YL15_EUMVA|nr:hypothetical protein EVAR_61113_1 [Eumeta japonica]
MSHRTRERPAECLASLSHSTMIGLPRTRSILSNEVPLSPCTTRSVQRPVNKPMSAVGVRRRSRHRPRALGPQPHTAVRNDQSQRMLSAVGGATYRTHISPVTNAARWGGGRRERLHHASPPPAPRASAAWIPCAMHEYYIAYVHAYINTLTAYRYLKPPLKQICADAPRGADGRVEFEFA